MNRRTWLASVAAGTFTSLWAGERAWLHAEEPRYVSPYRLEYRHPRRELEVGFHEQPWNEVGEEASVPHHEWYSERIRRRYGAWGPVARQYPPAPGWEKRSTEWMEDRVILSAARWLGLPYQHHHIPGWDPPEGWPWLKVAYGRNSRGIDCSNFSSFYYNFGLGIKLDTGIRQQAEHTRVRGPGGRGVITLERIEHQPYEELVQVLRPGDLLYIKNNAGHVGHVILWLGAVGVSPDGEPLVLDSTGPGHKDSSGHAIPIGVHMRPFSKSSWYAHSFSHAHRIIPALARREEGEVEMSDEGGAYEAG